MNSHARILLPALVLMAVLAWTMSSGSAQTSAPPAQSEQDHSAHHPETGQAVAPAPAAPGSAQGGQPAMMDGAMDPMMAMMRGMMAERGGMMFTHVEARLASIRSELQISDAQMPQWNRFADALRSAAKSMNGMHKAMMAEGMAATLPARLDLHEKMLAAHLKSLKRVQAALAPLYAALSDEQRKQVDQSMLGPMSKM